MSSEEELKDLKRTSLSGIISFALRSIVINALKFLSVYLLAIWFVPEDYGTFGLILSWFGVSCFFCDIGLASVLVQQQQLPSKRQLETTLAVQLILSSAIASLFIVFAAQIANYNGMSESAVEMIRALFFSLPILALRNPSKITLERSLRFNKIAAIELIEALVLYTTQLILAHRGLGAFSIIWANILRTGTGTLLYLIQGRNLYLPKLHLKTFKSMLPLGSRYQVSALLPSLKALIFPIIVGRVLDISTLGLISWTMGIVALPQFIALNYNSIFFPILSKLKTKQDEFKNMNLWAISLILPLIGIIYSMLSIYGQDIASLIFSQKWKTAFEFIQIAAIGFYFYLVRYLLAPFFNAGGNPQTRNTIEIQALFVEIALVSLGCLGFGAYGYLWAIVLSNIVSLVLSTRRTDKEFERQFIKHISTFVITYVICSLPKFVVNVFVAFPLSTILSLAITLCFYRDYREIIRRNVTRLRS